MTTHELVTFGYTWASLGSAIQEQIERITAAPRGELAEDLLEELCVSDLQQALEELRCCNVPGLVRLVDQTCQQAVIAQGA